MIRLWSLNQFRVRISFPVYKCFSVRRGKTSLLLHVAPIFRSQMGQWYWKCVNIQQNPTKREPIFPNKTKQKWHFTVFRFSCGCLPFLFFSNKLNDWNTTPTYMKAPPQNRHCVWVEKNLINAVSISLVKTVLLWVINDILRLLSLFGYPTEIMFNLTDFIWKSIEECTRQTFRSDFWVVTGSLQATGNHWLSDHFTPPIFEVRFKTEQYFWTDSNVNVWLKEVTLIFPRMLEIKSQRVLNFKFFFRRTP